MFFCRSHTHTIRISIILFYSLHLEFNVCVCVIFMIPVCEWMCEFHRILACGTFICSCFTATIVCNTWKYFYIVTVCCSLIFRLSFQSAIRTQMASLICVSAFSANIGWTCFTFVRLRIECSRIGEFRLHSILLLLSFSTKMHLWIKL